jgi:hypothetical protein
VQALARVIPGRSCLVELGAEEVLDRLIVHACVIGDTPAALKWAIRASMVRAWHRSGDEAAAAVTDFLRLGPSTAPARVRSAMQAR